MGRKHAIIIYPALKDSGGDLSKKWYVEYHWRVPGEKEPRRERIYKGLCEGTAEERHKIADEIIREKTEWLKSGTHLDGNPRKVYEDELMYRNEAKLYGKTKNGIITIRTNFPACDCSLFNFNKCIKNICKKANLNDKVLIESTKGHRIERFTKPKYSLVSSHTARRSFATNQSIFLIEN